MATSPIMPPDRHVPYKKGGWGAAILTTAAAVGAFLTAWYIHEQTYRNPRDPMMRQVYEDTSSSPHQPAHGAAAAEGGTPAHGNTGTPTTQPSAPTQHP